METINEAGGKFQSISEPWANTTTHAGKMIMTVCFRRHRRVRAGSHSQANRAGREAAKQRGVRLAARAKLDADQVIVAEQLLSEGKAMRNIARTVKVHEARIYRLAAVL